VNKFEALKQFQGWPAEWQRLCAEYWIETSEYEPAMELPRYDAPPSIDQPKAAKVAKKPRSRTDYTLEELDFFDSLIHCGVKPVVATERFCKRFPKHGHPVASLPGKFHERKKKLRDQGDL
jgi:hypothetical protein